MLVRAPSPRCRETVQSGNSVERSRLAVNGECGRCRGGGSDGEQFLDARHEVVDLGIKRVHLVEKKGDEFAVTAVEVSAQRVIRRGALGRILPRVTSAGNSELLSPLTWTANEARPDLSGTSFATVDNLMRLS